MNLKKTLSMILSVAMIFSSMCVFASTDVELPEDTATELTELTVSAIKVADQSDYYENKDNPEELTLDFGMAFSAKETVEDAERNDYYGYKVDFELTFDKEVTAILAGQYADSTWWDEENWIAITGEKTEGITFEANKPVRLMEVIGRGVNYKDVLEEIKNFNCGIKFAYDAPNDVTATLKLIMIPTEKITDLPVGEECTSEEDRKNHYTVVYSNGDRRCYDYDGTEEAIAIETVEYVHNRTAAQQVEEINNSADEIDTAVEAANVEALIADLSQEEKAEIKAETVKAIVEAKGETIDEAAIVASDAPAVFNVDSAIEVTAAPLSYGVEEALSQFVNVYEVTATDSATGNEVPEIDVPVLVAIPFANADDVIEVRHLHDGKIELLPFTVGANGDILYVQMSKFSQIAPVTKAVAAPGSDEAVLRFESVDAPRGQAKFDLYLEGANHDAVKGLLAGKFTLAPSGVDGVNYDYDFAIAKDAADNFLFDYMETELAENKIKYEINLNGFDKTNSYTVTAGAKILIGTLTVTSYGQGVINLENVEMVQHDYASTEENSEKKINVVATEGAMFDIEVPTQELTIEIDFSKHATVTNNNSSYQKMWIELSGAGINGVDVIELGNDQAAEGVVRAANKFTYTRTVLADGKYNITVKGDGYRKANYKNLNMGQNDKVIKFWNNYKDAAAVMEYDVVGGVETAVTGAKAYNANFLAGDIVMDNFIDNYDLSAVVSYFDMKNVTEAYAKYDLNRDKEIDSWDVAILLNSWNK